jgi:hypothetical protein
VRTVRTGSAELAIVVAVMAVCAKKAHAHRTSLSGSIQIQPGRRSRWLM